jgi:hypothetical protein
LRAGLLGAAAVRASRFDRLDAPELAARRVEFEGADVALRDFGALTTTGGRSLFAAPLPEFCWAFAALPNKAGSAIEANAITSANELRRAAM